MPSLPMKWGEMFYSDTGGSGSPLVFLHGSGCDAEDWDAVIRMLPKGVRATRLDFRGHGNSDAPDEKFSVNDLAADVLALVDHLGIRQMVLVGHSLGGMVAMNVAAQSTCAAGLVLLEGWTRLRTSRAFTGERFYGRLDRSSVEAIQKKSETTQKRFDRTVWGRFWESVETFDALPYLRAAGTPILEVYGELGRTDSTREMLMIPDNPKIRVIWVPNAGHYLPHEKPAEIAELSRKAAT